MSKSKKSNITLQAASTSYSVQPGQIYAPYVPVTVNKAYDPVSVKVDIADEQKKMEFILKGVDSSVLSESFRVRKLEYSRQLSAAGGHIRRVQIHLSVDYKPESIFLMTSMIINPDMFRFKFSIGELATFELTNYQLETSYIESVDSLIVISGDLL